MPSSPPADATAGTISDTSPDISPRIHSDTISVALCTYNGARFLEEQLASLLAQNRRPDELVVCDDRSTDSTVQMLESFSRSAPFPVRIQVNPVNLGSTVNFDRAMRLCAGSLIAFCDQDDIWLPHKLECNDLFAAAVAQVSGGGRRKKIVLLDGPRMRTSRYLLTGEFDQQVVSSSNNHRLRFDHTSLSSVGLLPLCWPRSCRSLVPTCTRAALPTWV